MNAPLPAGGRPLRAELAQAVERNALLHSHPAAASHPNLDQAIAETQHQIDVLAAELSAADELSEGISTSPSPIRR